MSGSNCPSRDELLAYVVGKLADGTSERVAIHVGACADCQAALTTLDDAEDTLVSGLRWAAVENQFNGEPECQAAVAQLEAIPGRSEFAGRVSTEEPISESTIWGELGEYRLLEKLGQGGMGTVYKAEHTKLKRVVALKVLPKGGVGDERMVARFEREMEAVGAVDHPHIVRATDAREIEGTPVLVMEYVEGQDLSKLVRRLGPLPIADACEVIRQAALGLQHAHEHGLVHRDVKPSNLMVTPDGQVKLLDLGLARFRPSQPAGKEMTAVGQAMGTADYMAPEQASDSRAADIRADIYSLGCTFYKLLTGHAPFSGPQYRSKFDKMIAHVRDPIPPIKDRRHDMPDELVAVLDRMLAKDPAERFATPAEVADALGTLSLRERAGLRVCSESNLPRLLAQAAQEAKPAAEAARGLPTTDKVLSSALVSTRSGGTARPVAEPPREPGTPLARRESGRAKWPLSAPRKWRPWAVAVGLMLLAAGVIGAYQLIIRIKDKEGRETVVQVPGGKEVSVERDGREVFRLPKAGRPEQPELPKPEQPASQPKPVAAKIAPKPLTLPEGAPLSRMALVTEPAPIKGLCCWTIATRGHRGAVHAVAYRPDGGMVATACDDGMARLWNPADGTFIRVLVGHDGAVKCVGWSPDGTYLASGSRDGTTRLWEVKSGRLLHTLHAHATEIKSVAWSPDGRILASGRVDGRVDLWDVTSGKTLHVLQAHEESVLALSWLSDGKTLVTSSPDNVVRLWDPATGALREVLRGGRESVWPLALSPDGTTLAATVWHPQKVNKAISIKLQDLETGQFRREFAKVSDCFWVSGLVWSPTGETLALAGHFYYSNRPVWDAEAGVLLRSRGPGGHHLGDLGLAYSPDGKTLAYARRDGAVNLCRTRSAQVLQTLPAHAAKTLSVAFSPDGKTLVSGYPTRGKVRVWETGSGEFLREVAFLSDHRAAAFHVALSSDGKLAVGGRISDAAMGNFRGLKGTHASDSNPAWSPDGQKVAFGGGLVHDAASGELLLDLKWGAAYSSPAWSPDGKAIAVWGSTLVKIYDAESGKLLKELGGGPGPNVLAWSPDGKTLAVGGGQNAVRVWDVESMQLLASQEAHRNSVISLRWLEDNKTLLSGSSSEVCVWDGRQGRVLRTIDCDAGAFSFDGQLVASRGESLIRLRRTADGQLLRTILSLRDKQYAAISPEGHFRGSPGVEKELVYVVQTETGQDTLTPEEFSQRYGWKNDPEKASGAGMMKDE